MASVAVRRGAQRVVELAGAEEGVGEAGTRTRSTA